MAVREGHITHPIDRVNLFTGDKEQFDPVQIFTSKSIEYAALECYCSTAEFQGRKFKVAFEVRQQPNSYSVGQETVGVGASPRGTRKDPASTRTIDPLFSNDELENYTKVRTALELQRLLVRVLDDTEPEPDGVGAAGPATPSAAAALGPSRPPRPPSDFVPGTCASVPRRAKCLQHLTALALALALPCLHGTRLTPCFL